MSALIVLLQLCIRSFTLSRGWKPANTLSDNLRHTNSALCFLNWIVTTVSTRGLSHQSVSKLQTNSSDTQGMLSKSLWHFYRRLPRDV